MMDVSYARKDEIIKGVLNVGGIKKIMRSATQETFLTTPNAAYFLEQAGVTSKPIDESFLKTYHLKATEVSSLLGDYTLEIDVQQIKEALGGGHEAEVLLAGVEKMRGASLLAVGASKIAQLRVPR